MPGPRIPLQAELQPNRLERLHSSNQTETEHNHTETWKQSMACHDHPVAGRPSHIPQTIPPAEQSRISLQRPEAMLRKPSRKPQASGPKKRTPPQNPQLQHRGSQPYSDQRRKQITFPSPVGQKSRIAVFCFDLPPAKPEG